MSLIPKPGDTAALTFWGLDSRGARSLVLGILSVVFVALGAWLLVTGSVAVSSTDSILANGRHVSARVVSTQSTVPNPVGAPEQTVVTTTVEFATASGTTVQADLPQSGLQLDAKPGSAVAIVYDATNPSLVLVDDPGVASSYAVGIWAGAGVLVAGGVFVFLTLRVLRKKPDPVA